MLGKKFRADTFLARILFALFGVIVCQSIILAERLPIKTYTSVDGLAHDHILNVVRDSKGFLWFCTIDGLSRFDGQRFFNYGSEQGLQGRQVYDLLETKNGAYWIATSQGLHRFDYDPHTTLRNRHPLDNRLFTVFRTNDGIDGNVFTSLYEDRSGIIWCGTDKALYRFDPSPGRENFTLISLNQAAENSGSGLSVRSLLIDDKGLLVVGADAGLYQMMAGGGWRQFKDKDGKLIAGVNRLYRDLDGALWVSSNYGAYKLVCSSGSHELEVAAHYTVKDGLPSNPIYCVFRSASGKLWIGTRDGLVELKSGIKNNSVSFTTYGRAQGLNDTGIHAIGEDIKGNLWLASDVGGAMRIAGNGFTTYDKLDGLGAIRVSSIFEDQSGQLHVTGSNSFVDQFYNGRFNSTRLTLPQHQTYYGWGWNQIMLQDHTGDWWLATGVGLLRYTRSAQVEQFSSARPLVYTTDQGLGSNEIFRVFEDSRGDIWIGTLQNSEKVLARWERSAGLFHQYSSNDGIPRAVPTAFVEDASGYLWIGFYTGEIVRYKDGQFQQMPLADNRNVGVIRSLYLDQSNRLWVATSDGGVIRVNNPGAEKPQAIIYGTKQGLATDLTTCVTQDKWGRIYIGTGRGVDRINPNTDSIYHYSTADGLASSYVNVSFRDHNGDLWFGTLQGISKLTPEQDHAESSPLVLVSGLRIAGLQHPVSELGERELTGLELKSAEKNLQIDFIALSFDPGDLPRYQYKLEGTDNDWSAPTTERTVHYANLSSGAYRFLVRAVTSNGAVSHEPAIVAFSILPPIWMRWWFVMIAMIVGATSIYAIGKYRVARLIELERVRTRIATDLHDDIGSSLSQVSTLSEVVTRRLGNDPKVAEQLSVIAELSRSLVDSMNDIVWAINPKRDRLSDLVHRMRRFASDVFTARDIEFRFKAPELRHDVRLSPDLRRETYLVFKESINNILRHSGCSKADIEFVIDRSWLKLTIGDNGKGIDQNRSFEGNGLVNMKHRATLVGGSLDVTSNGFQGTLITLTVPLNRRMRHTYQNAN